MFCELYLLGALGKAYENPYHPVASAISVVDGLLMELHEVSLKLGNNGNDYIHHLRCNTTHLIGAKYLHDSLHAGFASQCTAPNTHGPPPSPPSPCFLLGLMWKLSKVMNLVACNNNEGGSQTPSSPTRARSWGNGTCVCVCLAANKVSIMS